MHGFGISNGPRSSGLSALELEHGLYERKNEKHCSILVVLVDYERGCHWQPVKRYWFWQWHPLLVTSPAASSVLLASSGFMALS